MRIDLDGYQLDLSVDGGMLSVAVDGEPRGALMIDVLDADTVVPPPVVGPAPAPVEPADPPTLPEGWYYDGDVLKQADGSPVHSGAKENTNG